MNLRIYRLAIICSMLAFTTSLQAQNEGLDKLDAATSQKLNAGSAPELAKVIELCEAALKAGLDEGNSKIAKNLLAASALQRAQLMLQTLPRIANNVNAVRELRRKTLADLDKAIEHNPELAEAHILRARIETLPGGSRQSAMESLDKAIGLLKDKPVDQAQTLILRAALQEDNEAKLADLAKAIEADPTNVEAWQARVAMQMVMGKLEEAVADAESLLAKDESNIFALQAAIESLIGLQKADKAIELLNTRIDKDSKNGMLYRLRARTYIIKSATEEAAAKKLAAANAATEPAVTEPAADQEIKATLAGDADTQRALEDLNRAIEISPRDAEALVMRGQIYFDMDEIAKSNRDISDALLIEKDSAQAVLMRSLLAAREQRYADAIQDMERLVRFNPSNVAWVMQLAQYYQLDARPRLAISLLDELVRNDKNDWRAMRLRGDAKLSVSMHVEAIDDYESAIRILEDSRAVAEDQRSSDIDYSGLLNNLAWVLATSPKDELRDGKKSVELGLKACEATQYKAAHILSTLAAGYAETGDFDNARKWSEKAVELGSKEDIEQLEQLKKELESYQENKPWREQQNTQENEKPLSAASATIDT